MIEARYFHIRPQFASEILALTAGFDLAKSYTPPAVFYISLKAYKMTKEEYTEKLKDPKWIERKKEILARDNHTCQYCRKQDIILHVHHKYYKKDLTPWDYPDEALITLCEICHKTEHVMIEEIERKFFLACKFTFPSQCLQKLTKAIYKIDTEFSINELTGIIIALLEHPSAQHYIFYELPLELEIKRLYPEAKDA